MSQKWIWSSPNEFWYQTHFSDSTKTYIEDINKTEYSVINVEEEEELIPSESLSIIQKASWNSATCSSVSESAIAAVFSSIETEKRESEEDLKEYNTVQVPVTKPSIY